MARAQFNYLIENFQFGMASVIEQFETWVVTKVKRPIICGPYTLSPKDVKEWPAAYEVEVEPFLPQNLMAEAQLYDSMWNKGHVTRRTVREQGLQMDDPELEDRERMLEDTKSMLKPVLLQDVLRYVGVLPPDTQTQSQILGPDGRPISGEDAQAGQTSSREGQGGSRQDGSQQRAAATLQQGTVKQPPRDPGTV